MQDCIFCNIAAGKLPSYKVYEDENYLAFLDISPRVKGHTLLIPKKHYQWVYDVPNFGQYWEVALKITKGLQKSLSPSFVGYLTHGLEVPHAHIHITPRKTETAFVPEVIQLEKGEFESLREKITQALND